jgi:adenine/guanine phosphoribosyltransferase-like PRPP-binding protein
MAVESNNQLSDRYVPLGYSQKFWNTDRLSTEVSSITSPSGLKKLYLDPNQLSLVRGKRAIIIDDAVSSGKTLQASWNFLESEEVGAQILVAGVVMRQGDRWKALLDEKRVRWVYQCPLLRAVEGGWDIREYGRGQEPLLSTGSIT